MTSSINMKNPSNQIKLGLEDMGQFTNSSTHTKKLMTSSSKKKGGRIKNKLPKYSLNVHFSRQT